MEERINCSLGASFPLSTIFSIFLLLKESNYIFVCEMWLFDLFLLNFANLICRGKDISKYLRVLWTSR